MWSFMSWHMLIGNIQPYDYNIVYCVLPMHVLNLEMGLPHGGGVLTNEIPMLCQACLYIFPQHCYHEQKHNQSL